MTEPAGGDLTAPADSRRGRLIGTLALLLAGVAIWIAFLVWREPPAAAMANRLVEALFTVPVVLVLLLAAKRYRDASGTRTGFGIAAAVLLLMAVWVFWPYGWVGATVLVLGAVVALALAVAGSGNRAETATHVKASGAASDGTLLFRRLWIAAGVALGLSFAIVLSPVGIVLNGALDVPERVQNSFNLLSIIILPLAIGALIAFSGLTALVHRAVSRRVARGAIVAALATGAVLLPALSAPNLRTDPFWLLLYDLPVVATALYAVFARRGRAISIIGVTAASFSLGLLMFVLTWALVGGPTD